MKKRRLQVPETELAVFARNHVQHFEEACEASSASGASTELRVFRSDKGWVTAARVVSHHGSVPIYFAVVDAGSTVRYEAELVEVHLNPSRTDPKTKELLKHRGKTTALEPLDDGVETLYVVRGCRRLDDAFPQTELIKFKGGAR
jgi:hypothetical protein